MTDKAWAEGMAALRLAGLSGWPSDARGSQARGRVYRDALDDLTDDQWLHAAREAARNEVQWFPTPGKLREYASSWRNTRMLPAPSAEELEAADERARAAREQEREAARAAARKGLELVRAAVGIKAPLVGAMPRATPAEGAPVVLTDARRDELKRQAAQITREEA